MSLLRGITGPKVVFKRLSTTSTFTTVYKFPYVRGAGLVNRMKLYQTALASISLSTAGVLNQIGVLSQDGLLFTAILGIGGIVPLYGFGYFTNRLIGIVYLNDESNLVKISYLNFWGGRVDVVVPVNEIVPFSEVPHSVTDPLYLKVRQFSSRDTLKLCTKYGILDSRGFNKIFAGYVVYNFNPQT